MPTDRTSHSFLHPTSGAVILALDWILFSGNVLSLGLGSMALSSIGFVLGLIGVAVVQHRYGSDPMITSGLKGLLAGVVVGVPLPVAGTAVGGVVLSLSGLDRWKKLLLPGRSDDTETQTTHGPSDSGPSHSTGAGESTRSKS
jgi:hypothetical protein